MATVEYAERVRDTRLPDPTDRELADIRRAATAGRAYSTLDGSFLKVVAPMGEEGGELSGGAILVTLPGESASVVTCMDGHQMAKQGRAGPALAIAAIGSFFAGTVGTILIALFGPPLAEMALKFGAPEYFSLMVMGLIAASVPEDGLVLYPCPVPKRSVSAGTTLTSSAGTPRREATRFAYSDSRPSDSIVRLSTILPVGCTRRNTAR